MSLLEFLCATPVIVLALLITQTKPSMLIGFFLLGIVLQFFLVHGISLVVASMSVELPDTSQVVRIVVRALFYLSPILYAATNIPNFMQNFVTLNPLVGILSLYRLPFLRERTFRLPL